MRGEMETEGLELKIRIGLELGQDWLGIRIGLELGQDWLGIGTENN